MRKAALDLGSNTFLLLIVEQDHSGIRVLRDETRFVRLAEGMNESGRISDVALMRAKACLEEYRSILNDLDVTQCEAVATSAARDAKNADEFKNILQQFGFSVQIITGDEEAQLTFFGASIGLDLKHDQYGVLDIGGGSTEIALFQKKDHFFKKSLDIGSVRLTESHLRYGPLMESEIETAKDFIYPLMAKEIGSVKIDSGRFFDWVAVAGTPVVLAQLELKTDYDESKIHGFRLDRSTITKWLSILAPQEIKERSEHLGMPASRADIIVAGSLIMSVFLELVGSDSIVVSTKGLRYGLVSRR